MTAVRVSCPTCRVTLQVNAVRPDGSVRCPSCAKSFALPPAPAAVPRRSILTHPVVITAALAATVIVLGVSLVLLAKFAATPVSSTSPNAEPGPVSASPDDPVRATVVPAPPPTEWLSADKQREVNSSIEKAVAWLRKHLSERGDWRGDKSVGLASLSGLVLLETGTSVLDLQVKAAADHVRATALGLGTGFQTYELSLSVLFLDRLGDPADEPLIKSLALRILGGQLGDGGWAYDCPQRSSTDELPALLKFLTETRAKPGAITGGSSREDDPTQTRRGDADRELMPLLRTSDPARAKEALTHLPHGLHQIPSVHMALADKVPERLPFSGSDNSNTQFALLALWTASRHDLPVERALALATKRFRTSQSPNHDWGYRSGEPGSPAMSGVGLLGLAIGHGLRPKNADGKPTRDPAIDDGLKRFATHLGPETTNLYFLWTLERVAVLYGLRKIDGKDWYGWGSDTLVKRQSPQGFWAMSGYHGSTPLIDTCFALLFLRRANLTADLTGKLESTLQLQRTDP